MGARPPSAGRTAGSQAHPPDGQKAGGCGHPGEKGAAVPVEMFPKGQLQHSGPHLAGGGCCPVTNWSPTLCDPRDRSTPGFPALHQLREFAQTHVRGVGDAN